MSIWLVCRAAALEQVERFRNLPGAGGTNRSSACELAVLLEALSLAAIGARFGCPTSSAAVQHGMELNVDITATGSCPQ